MSRGIRFTAALVAVTGLSFAGPALGCGDAAPADPATIRAGGGVFSQSGCGTCHTLGAAGSRGRIGPSLDERQPDADDVDGQVREGGGGMPAYTGRLSDEEIRAVSAYVAEVAGR